MNIVSPKHSLVKFDNSIKFILPAFEYFDTGFQFMMPSSNNIPAATDIMVRVVNMQHQSIYASPLLKMQNKCSWGKITGVDFPMTIGAGQPLPPATYNNMEEFLAGLRDIGLNATSDEFLQCCMDWVQDFTFTYNTNKTGAINYYKGLQYLYMHIVFKFTVFFPGIEAQVGQCFKIEVDIPGDQKYYSNVFQRVETGTFYSLIEYDSNENGYGFSYPEALTNRALVPCYLRFPRYPEKRKMYMFSNKNYKVRSSDIEREWELTTDEMPDSFHSKMAVALAHDNFRVTNIYSEVSGFVYKKDDYVIDWSDDPTVRTAPAKCKVLQPFAGRNSNCEKREPCCIPVKTPVFDLPDGTIGVAYMKAVTLSGRAPFGIFNIVKPGWMQVQIVGKELQFFGTPTSAATGIVVKASISNCNGASAVSFEKTMKTLPVPAPSLTMLDSTGTVGSTRQQSFKVGAVVAIGNRFVLTVYGHDVSVTAISGDTPTTIAQKLAAAVNATTPSQWGSSVPAPGTVGFPPVATFTADVVYITLNYQNSFIGSAFIS